MTYQSNQAAAAKQAAPAPNPPMSAARRSAFKRLAGLAGVMALAPLQLEATAQEKAGLRSSAKLSTKPKAKSPPAELPKPEKRRFIIAAAQPTSLAYLPMWVAQKLGSFEQQGLELELLDQQSNARAMQAVGSGQADAMCAWLENALSPAGRALGLQSYALMGSAPMMALGVAAKTAPASSSIQSLAQLRGRMLGVVALDSPTHTMALAVLRRAGIKSADVRIVSVGSATSAAAALRSGQIDALMHMDPLIQQLEQRGDIRVLADLRSPEKCESALGTALPSSCLCATAEFLQRYPGMAQASANAMRDALFWLARASLRDILTLLPDRLPGIDTQLFVASLVNLRTSYSPDGLCSAEQVAGVWQAMIEAQPTLRLELANPQLTHTNVFMQRGLIR